MPTNIGCFKVFFKFKENLTDSTVLKTGETGDINNSQVFVFSNLQVVNDSLQFVISDILQVISSNVT